MVMLLLIPEVITLKEVFVFQVRQHHIGRIIMQKKQPFIILEIVVHYLFQVQHQLLHKLQLKLKRQLKRQL